MASCDVDRIGVYRISADDGAVEQLAAPSILRVDIGIPGKPR